MKLYAESVFHPLLHSQVLIVDLVISTKLHAVQFVFLLFVLFFLLLLIAVVQESWASDIYISS
jgi:hypothetical protein